MIPELVAGVLGANLLGGAAWIGACKRVYRHPSRPDGAMEVPTGDRWRLAVHRYRPSPKRKKHPVILCPGLGANRVSFDLGPEGSLARRLAGKGYEVFVPELRGHGLSERPRLFRGGKRFGWTFDDYLLHDLPAILEAVRREVGQEVGHEAGHEAVHWVGHSMGGILLYGLLARGASDRIRSGVTVGSSVDYSRSESWFHPIARLAFLVEVLPALPLGLLSLMGAPLALRGKGSLADRFVVWPSNVEPGLYRLLQATCFHAVSSGVLRQLATAFQPGGLLSPDGAFRYLEALPRATAPVLAVGGDRDKQCPPEAVRVSFEALGSRDKRLLLVGKEWGQRDHYGHFDLLMGRRAAEEVLPAIEDWLDAHD